MTTIYIHPTATQPAALLQLQRQTGRMAVIGRRHARLVSHHPFTAPRADRAANTTANTGPGPSAA